MNPETFTNATGNLLNLAAFLGSLALALLALLFAYAMLRALVRYHKNTKNLNKK